MYYQSGAVFIPYTAECSSEIIDNDEAKGLLIFLFFTFMFIPLVGVFGINLVLLGIAIRKSYSVNSGINYKALFVILSLSGLFMLSWVPYLVIVLFRVMKSPFDSPTFALFAINAMSLNTFGNPFLYTLTNRSFGRYVRSLICGMFKAVRRNMQIAHRTGNREENLPLRNEVRDKDAVMQSSSLGDE